MKKNVLLLCALLTIAGCGGKKSSNNPIDTVYLQDGEKLSGLMQKLRIDSKTPEGLGTLVSLNEGIYSQNNAGLCTWFLVGANRAMTNSHCVPEALRSPNNLNCGDYLQGLIQTGTGQKTVRCKKVLFFSKMHDAVILSNDYALIELNKSFPEIETLKLERSGVVENQKINILTMTHHQSESGVQSEFKKQTCILKSSDSLGRISSAGSSPIIGFQEENSGDFCKTIGGNSGSPVVERAGKLIGILHGGVKDGVSLNATTPGSINLMTNNLSVFTNLRCQKFNDPSFDSDYPAECQTEAREQKPEDAPAFKEIAAKFAKDLKDAEASLPTFLEYDVSLDSGSGVSKIFFLPKCMKPLSEWDSTSKAKIVKGTVKDSVGQYKNELTQSSVDYYGNYKMKFSFHQWGKIDLAISGFEQFEAKKTVLMEVDLSQIGNPRKVSQALPMCTDVTAEDAVEE